MFTGGQRKAFWISCPKNACEDYTRPHNGGWGAKSFHAFERGLRKISTCLWGCPWNVFTVTKHFNHPQLALIVENSIISKVEQTCGFLVIILISSQYVILKATDGLSGPGYDPNNHDVHLIIQNNVIWQWL